MRVTIGDLRSRGGQIIDRVAKGGRCVITRNGVPVAELRPLAPPGPSIESVLAEWRRLPQIDQQRVRDDIDALMDTSL